MSWIATFMGYHMRYCAQRPKYIGQVIDTDLSRGILTYQNQLLLCWQNVGPRTQTSTRNKPICSFYTHDKSSSNWNATDTVPGQSIGCSSIKSYSLACEFSKAAMAFFLNNEHCIVVTCKLVWGFAHKNVGLFKLTWCGASNHQKAQSTIGL